MKLHFHPHRAELRARESPSDGVMYYTAAIVIITADVAAIAVAVAATSYYPIQIIACRLDSSPIFVDNYRTVTLASFKLLLCDDSASYTYVPYSRSSIGLQYGAQFFCTCLLCPVTYQQFPISTNGSTSRHQNTMWFTLRQGSKAHSHS